MAQYPASGILFQNDRKEKPTQPDYTGNIELEPEVIRESVRQKALVINHKPLPTLRLLAWMMKSLSKIGEIPWKIMKVEV